MNLKQLVGFIALSLGVILIISATHAMGYIEDKPPMPQPLTNSPISPTEHLPQNQPIPEKGVCGGMWFGILLVLGGGFLAIRYRK